MNAPKGSGGPTGAGARGAYYTGPWVEVLPGESTRVLADFEENTFDAVIADPPYGLSKEPDPAAVLSRWLAGEDYEHPGGGFMNEKWDAFVPGPNLWRAVLRSLKPGGYLLCFAGSRTGDLMGISLRLAGFKIRDTIPWLHGEGMVHSLNVSEAVAERLSPMQGERRRALGMVPLAGPESAHLAASRGLGTALKPAHEPIIVAQKPLAEPTFAANVISHGTGALNVDACRIEGEKGDGVSWGSSNATLNAERMFNASPRAASYRGERDERGRWPKNVLFSHHPDCNGSCSPGCPVEELDQQSGILKSGANPVRRSSDKFQGIYSPYAGDRECDPARGPDSGGASRFFFCAKAGSSERELGLEGFEERPILWSNGTKNPGSFQSENSRRASRNPHVTVKPLKLMRWLVRLVAGPGALVLDPFAGSGTTGMAATFEGVRSVLIEREDEYLPVIRARVEYAERIGSRPGEKLQSFVPRKRTRPDQAQPRLELWGSDERASDGATEEEVSVEEAESASRVEHDERRSG